MASVTAGRFTNIVGYDSLLKEDEKKAFEILKKKPKNSPVSIVLNIS